ncbi:hypothetical protein Bca52824_033404 [Brassica carinata]|uniref:Uncharacterized protein n=1 Tax=Brassica carinata TaxID=52824 RepID=A0A8X7SEE8_BRACI|nr:hypothetical protein Bca52824_033404 [Brassica carinata]
MSTPPGRKRLRRPTYESTFLSGQTDQSASTSCTATQSETVPESQSQERSAAASAPLPPWVPPAPYVPPPHAAKTHLDEEYRQMKASKNSIDMLGFVADAHYGIPPDSLWGESSTRCLDQVSNRF